MEEIYISKGMDQQDAKIMCDTLSQHKDAWVDIMMIEELGIIVSDDNPIKNGAITFASFVCTGLTPLLPYIVGAAAKTETGLFAASICITAVILIVMGVTKTKVTGANPYLSGLEMLILGGFAAGIAYLISWGF